MPARSSPRVLISYFFGERAIPLGLSCESALQALGCETARFDCRVGPRLGGALQMARRLARTAGWRDADPAARLGLDNLTVRERALERAVDAFEPDLLLVLRGNHYRAQALERIRARHPGLVTAMWWLYGPEERASLAQDAALYDHASCIYRTTEGGGAIGHLPALAVDRSLYGPEGPRTPHEADVAFVGRASERRLQVMRGLTDLPIRIWGAGWRKPRDGWNPALWRMVAGRWIEGDALLDAARPAGWVPVRQAAA